MRTVTVKLNLGDILPKPHKCNCCGTEHTRIPQDSRAQRALLNDYNDGFFFECECGSTMFVRVTQEVAS